MTSNVYKAGTLLKEMLALALLTAFVGGCATQLSPRDARQEGTTYTVYLVAHDDHTGIALKRADIPAGLWPESRDFSRAEFLEVGWGARDYYMGRDDGFWGALKAALGTQSVLHVAGLPRKPGEYFGGSEVVEIPVTPDNLARMVHAISDAYDRGGAAVAAPLGAGLYGDSRFYPARERFSLLNTCNVWTARVLRSGGLPVEDAITKEGLMSQARALVKRDR